MPEGRSDNVTPIREGVKIKEHNPESPLLLCPTTENPRRLGALMIAFPGVDMQSVPGGDEEETLNENEIAKNKIMHGRGYVERVLWNAAGENVGKGKAKVVYIAGDTRVAPLQLNEFGVADTQSIWKPETVEQIRDVFVGIMDAATHPEQKYAIPHYAIRSGSGILIDDPQKNDQELHSTYFTTTMTLNPMMIDHLSTPEGFARYIEECNKFHESDLYGEVGEKQVPGEKPTILKIAGGLELAVLVKMGAVTEIDSIPASDPQFRDKLQDSLYTAFVGISPKMLNLVDPQAEQRLKGWEWMNKIADYAMEGTKTPQSTQAPKEEAVA